MVKLLRPGHVSRYLDGRLVLIRPAALRRARADGLAMRRGTAAGPLDHRGGPGRTVRSRSQNAN
jgi:hypothetical protein